MLSNTPADQYIAIAWPPHPHTHQLPHTFHSALLLVQQHSHTNHTTLISTTLSYHCCFIHTLTCHNFLCSKINIVDSKFCMKALVHRPAVTVNSSGKCYSACYFTSGHHGGLCSSPTGLVLFNIRQQPSHLTQCNALLISKIALVYFETELQTMAWYNLRFTTSCVYARSWKA